MSLSRLGQWQIQFIMIVGESVTVDVNEDGITDGDRRNVSIPFAHDLIHDHSLTDCRDDDDRNRTFEFDCALRLGVR